MQRIGVFLLASALITVGGCGIFADDPPEIEILELRSDEPGFIITQHHDRAHVGVEAIIVNEADEQEFFWTTEAGYFDDRTENPAEWVSPWLLANEPQGFWVSVWVSNGHTADQDSIHIFLEEP